MKKATNKKAFPPMKPEMKAGKPTMPPVKAKKK
jgi:hypothetical protein